MRKEYIKSNSKISKIHQFNISDNIDTQLNMFFIKKIMMIDNDMIYNFDELIKSYSLTINGQVIQRYVTDKCRNKGIITLFDFVKSNDICIINGTNCHLTVEFYDDYDATDTLLHFIIDDLSDYSEEAKILLKRQYKTNEGISFTYRTDVKMEQKIRTNCWITSEELSGTWDENLKLGGLYYIQIIPSDKNTEIMDLGHRYREKKLIPISTTIENILRGTNHIGYEYNSGINSPVFVSSWNNFNFHTKSSEDKETTVQIIYRYYKTYWVIKY